MTPFDLRIYAAHAVFWLAFAVGDRLARHRSRRPPDVVAPPAVASRDDGQETLRAPHAGLLVAIHMVAFAFMYAGIGRVVFGGRMPVVPASMRAFGALVILAGGILVGWARLSFESWRFRAELDAGHRLATGGPFRWIRHPIYAGLDLLALGTALWMPTTLTWLGALGMAVGGDLRARAEEPLLERAFGETFREYRRRTHRFVPGIY